MDHLKTLLCSVALFWVAAAPVVAQTNDISADFLLRRLEEKIIDYTNLDHKVMRAEIGNIHQDSLANVYRSLAPGKRYEIFAFANPDEISDIDLKVYREVNDEWRLEIQDRADSPEGRIRFEPAVHAIYRIVVAGYRFPRYEYGKYGLIISTLD